MNKEVLLEQMHALGFELQEFPGMGYGFHYDDTHYVLFWDEEGEESDSVCIAIPNIFEVNPDNRMEVLELVNNIGARLKYIKAVAMNEGMWLFYEYYLNTEENLEELIEHMVRVLQMSLYFFYQQLEGGTEEVESEE